jgi:hypothetical protein
MRRERVQRQAKLFRMEDGDLREGKSGAARQPTAAMLNSATQMRIASSSLGLNRDPLA